MLSQQEKGKTVGGKVFIRLNLKGKVKSVGPDFAFMFPSPKLQWRFFFWWHEIIIN